MTVIRIPKPPQSAINHDRPVSSLLKTQLVHLQEAEFRLPVHHQTNIYINRIKTEREAAEYIRQVTARLHPEGAPTKARRGKKRESSPGTIFTLAAVAAKIPAKRTTAKTRAKAKAKSKTKSKSGTGKKKS
jgi:hypothetical protein